MSNQLQSIGISGVIRGLVGGLIRVAIRGNCCLENFENWTNR